MAKRMASESVITLENVNPVKVDMDAVWEEFEKTLYFDSTSYWYGNGFPLFPTVEDFDHLGMTLMIEKSQLPELKMMLESGDEDPILIEKVPEWEYSGHESMGLYDLDAIWVYDPDGKSYAIGVDPEWGVSVDNGVLHGKSLNQAEVVLMRGLSDRIYKEVGGGFEYSFREFDLLGTEVPGVYNINHSGAPFVTVDCRDEKKATDVALPKLMKAIDDFISERGLGWL